MKTIHLIIAVAFITLTSSALGQGSTAVPVISATAKSAEFADVIEALGTLKSNNSVTITSTVTELVTEIHFTDGQRVKKGDLLVVMNTADEDALLMEEQSRLGEAKRQVARLQPLADKNATSKSAFDTQQGIVSVSQARIQGIQSQLNKRRITAPFDGVIGFNDISVGTLAQPGFQLATLDDDSAMKMDFSVPERHLASLRPGLKIEATSQAFPDQNFSGEIASIDSRINPNTRAVQVRAIINNEARLLKPGILMRIKLKTQPRTALLIPEEAITTAGQQLSVFVINHGPDQSKVVQTNIQQGTRYGGEIEILSGLATGDEVVIHGTLRIKDGSEVTVIANQQGDETLAELLAQKSTPASQGG